MRNAEFGIKKQFLNSEIRIPKSQFLLPDSSKDSAIHLHAQPPTPYSPLHNPPAPLY
jgi:hypothetical protein